MVKKVLKFGGTSVGTIDRIQHVANIIKKEYDGGNQVIVVVSAMAGKTNELIKLSQSITEDFNLREYDEKDSLILERVFNLYQAEDNRESFDELNDGYHPKDRTYDDMWKFIDSAREAVEDIE